MTAHDLAAVEAAKDTDELCDIYDAWIDANEFEPPMSADELLAELWANTLNDNERVIGQRRWLSAFIAKWESFNHVY